MKSSVLSSVVWAVAIGVVVGSSPLAAQVPGYNYARAITIDHRQVVNSDQSDFPVLISGTFPFLATVGNGGHVQNANGYDIVFTSDAAGQNKLDHEIDTYSPVTGAAAFWLRIPTLSHTSDTPIYMWYGNSSVSTSQENKPGVWSNHYVSVFHFGSSTSLSLADSTGSGNTLTNVSATASAGKMGGSASTGSGQYLYNAAPTGMPTGANPRTVQVWYKQAIANTGAWIAGYGSTPYFLAGTSTLLTYGQWTGSAWQTVNSTGTNDSNWHFFASTLSSPGAWANVAHYLDGTAQSVTTGASGSLQTTGDALYVGRQNSYNGNFFSGQIDEVRISDVARSADWIATEYNNQNSPGTFAFVSPTEYAGTEPSPYALILAPSTFSFSTAGSIDHRQVANSDQTDFPVLISGTFSYLATIANGGQVQNANGYDIVFTSDAAGQNKLDHEIDSYDPTTGTAAFWVRIPALSHTSDTPIYMWYGNSNVVASQENKPGVWSNHYVSVFHFGKSTSLSMTDSTGQRNTLTNVSATASAGKMGGSVSTGNGQYLYNASPTGMPTGANPRTVQVWYKQANANTGSWIAGYGSTPYFLAGTSTLLTYGQWTGSAWQTVNSTGTNDSNWHFFASTLSSPGAWANVAHYLDGTAQSVTTGASGTLQTTGDALYVGRQNSYNGNFFSGQIDEVRISDVARSADWIATEYNGEVSPDHVQITSPLNGATFSSASPVVITADAWTSPFSQVVKVDFFADGVNIGESTSAPFSVSASLAVGNHTLTATVTDSLSRTATSASVSVVAVPVLSITTSSLQDATQNATYSRTLAASGGATPYTWSITTGSLPAGLALNASTGVISGTPTTIGTSNFTAHVADGSSQTADKALSITVDAPPSITTSSLTFATQSSAYSATLADSGGASPLTWSIVSGSLPAGLSLNASSGVISGTPTGTGTSSFTVQVTDANSSAATQNLSIAVYAPLGVSTSSLPDGTQNGTYSATVAATGGSTPYSWSISSGALPPGLTLNAGSGVISGTATTSGTFNFTTQVTDANSTTATQSLSLIVNGPVAITTTSLPNTTQAMNYSVTLGATGGTPPYTWSISAGTVPDGVQLSSGGLLMGWPANVGTSDFTVTVTDTNGVTASQPLSLVVLQNVVQLTDSQQHQSTYTATVTGGSFYVTDSTGSGCASCSLRGETHSVFDANGNLTSVSDALGHTVEYTYDADNNIASETGHPDANTSATTNYTYNSFGEPLTAEDALGKTTTYQYDSHGNLTYVTTPPPDANTPASVTHYEYNSLGQLTKITDPLSHVTTVTYTPAGLVQTITDAQQNVTTYEYDARGNRTAIVDANQKRTEFDYDIMNRLTAIRYPDNNSKSVTFGYDTRGRRTSVTDQNNRTTTYSYDDADRLLTVTDAANNVTTYAYDTENNVTDITDANTHTTHFDYDAFGRATKTTFPSSRYESYGYDAVGNLTSKTDRKNQTIQYSYDGVNRLTDKTYPDTTAIHYVYDLDGRLTQVTDPTGTYGFTFDDMGRLTGTTTQYSFLSGQFTNSYGYDAASNRNSFTAPDTSTVSYVYDTLNRLQTLTSSFAGQFGFGYDALSRRTSLTRPNGVSTGYSYDSMSHLLSVLHQAGGVTIDGASYTLDDAGNRTNKQNLLNGITDDYGYDLIYQLTSVAQGGNTIEEYTYDGVGNRLTSLGVASYSNNESNQLTSTSNATFTYDYNGNTNSKTDASGTTSYAWDYENRLTSVTLPASAGTVSFKYDPFGRRIQKSGPLGTTNYLYDGANVVTDLNATGAVIASYAQGTEVDEPLAVSNAAGTAYYEADGLGSITSLSDASGITDTYTYDAFGSTTANGTNQNRYRYTGREYDPETGLYFYRARIYDPTRGRFLSEDLLGFGGGGTNLYTYVGNDPIDLTDPLGQRPLTDCEKKTLAPFIPKVDLDKADVHPGEVPWYFHLVSKDFEGITRGHDIYFRPGIFDPTTVEGLAKLGHELVHVGQYRNGLTWEKYLWASRHSYDKNPYEKPAYDKQAEIESTLRREKCNACQKQPGDK